MVAPHNLLYFMDTILQLEKLS